MKRALLLLLAAAVALPGPAQALRVVAATNDLGAVARAVGGPHIDLDVVARPDRDPHAMEVRPSTMRKTAKADLYLKVGLSLDLWSRDIVRGSRNRNLTVVDCAEAIDPLDVPAGKVDASMGDVHPEGNPHYWLDPENAVLVARHLARRFAAADPDHAAQFEANAVTFAHEIERRLPNWDAALRGRSFVEYHRTWSYLAERFGMRIVGEVEPLPGIPPSARHLALLSEIVRSESPAAVIHDAYHPTGPLEFLERETGVRTALVPSSCAEPTPAAYFALFDDVARALANAGEGRRVIAWIVDPWSYPFMRWALLCCLVLAGIHAYLGFHVVRRGVLFVDLAMAQMAALGAAIGIVLGLEHDSVGEYAISAAFALGAAGLFALVRSRRVDQEAIVAVFYGMAMAATFVVLEHSPHGLEEVKHLLVGQVLTVAPSKVLLTAGLYAAMGVLLAAFHKHTVAVTEGRANSRPIALEFLFFGTFALVVTSSVGLVGVLLVFALLVLPAVAALLLAGGSLAALAWGWGLAGAGSLIGLHAAYHLDLPAAPVIVLTLGVLLLGAVIASRFLED